jgi:hypothetical protein
VRVERVLKDILPPEGQPGQSKRRKTGGQESNAKQKPLHIIGRTVFKSLCPYGDLFRAPRLGKYVTSLLLFRIITAPPKTVIMLALPIS